MRDLEWLGLGWDGEPVYQSRRTQAYAQAFQELERQGLVYSQRTAGRFITEDSKMIQNLKNQLATDQILDFFKKMNQLGFTKEETIKLMQQLGSKEDAK